EVELDWPGGIVYNRSPRAARQITLEHFLERVPDPWQEVIVSLQQRGRLLAKRIAQQLFQPAVVAPQVPHEDEILILGQRQREKRAVQAARRCSRDDIDPGFGAKQPEELGVGGPQLTATSAGHHEMMQLERY